MYIVVTGRLRVLVPSPEGSGKRTVGEVRPGYQATRQALERWMPAIRRDY